MKRIIFMPLLGEKNEWKGFVSVILSYTLSKLTSRAVKHGKSVTSIGHSDKKSYQGYGGRNRLFSPFSKIFIYLISNF